MSDGLDVRTGLLNQIHGTPAYKMPEISLAKTNLLVHTLSPCAKYDLECSKGWLAGVIPLGRDDGVGMVGVSLWLWVRSFTLLPLLSFLRDEPTTYALYGYECE